MRSPFARRVYRPAGDASDATTREACASENGVWVTVDGADAHCVSRDPQPPMPCVIAAPDRFWLRPRPVTDHVGPEIPAGTSITITSIGNVIGHTTNAMYAVTVSDGEHAGESGYAVFSYAHVTQAVRSGQCDGYATLPRITAAHDTGADPWDRATCTAKGGTWASNACTWTDPTTGEARVTPSADNPNNLPIAPGTSKAVAWTLGLAGLAGIAAVTWNAWWPRKGRR